jgi:uncharacterized protein (DUF433 family)
MSKPRAQVSHPGPGVIDIGTSWISKTPNVCGGDACIRRTRITVWGLVEWRLLGMSDAWLLEQIEGLTPPDLAAAWEYAASHEEEIERAIRENEEA